MNEIDVFNILDEEEVLFLCGGGEVKVYDLINKKKVFGVKLENFGKTSVSTFLAISEIGCMVCGSYDGHIRCLDGNSKLIFDFKYNKKPTCLAYFENTTDLLAGYEDGRVAVYNLSRGTVMEEQFSVNSSVSCVLPLCKYAYISCHRNGRIIMWKRGGNMLSNISGVSTRYIRDIKKFGEKRLIASDMKYLIRMEWNYSGNKNGNVVKKSETACHNVTSVIAFSELDLAVTISSSGSIRVWKDYFDGYVRTQNETIMTTPYFLEKINDRSFAVIGSNNYIYIYNLGGNNSFLELKASFKIPDNFSLECVNAPTGQTKANSYENIDDNIFFVGSGLLGKGVEESVISVISDPNEFNTNSVFALFEENESWFDYSFKTDCEEIRMFKSLVLINSEFSKESDLLKSIPLCKLGETKIWNLFFGELDDILSFDELFDWYMLFSTLKMKTFVSTICAFVLKCSNVHSLLSMFAKCLNYLEKDEEDEEEDGEEKEEEKEFLDKVGIKVKFKSVFTLSVFNGLRKLKSSILASYGCLTFLEKLNYLSKLISHESSTTGLMEIIDHQELKLGIGFNFIESFSKLFRRTREKLFIENENFSNLYLRTQKSEIKRKFKVHLEILIFQSSFFFKMFLFPGRESQEASSSSKEVLIEVMEEEALQQLLEFIYLGSCSSKEVVVCCELLKHSEMFFQSELKDVILKKLKNLYNIAEKNGMLEVEVMKSGHMLVDLPETLRDTLFSQFYSRNFMQKKKKIENIVQYSVDMEKKISELEELAKKK